MHTLVSPALTELTTESGTYRILDEWLAYWFDGGTRALVTGGTAVVWPAAARRFGQGPIAAQPLESDVEIRVVLHPRAESASPLDTTLYQGKLVTEYVTLNFWVRAKAQGKGQATLLAQTVAERLKALLTHPEARTPLAVLGICHLQPQGPASPMPSTDYAERLLSCAAQLQYGMALQ